MKPVVIFRHARSEGAGYLGTFLAQRDIPWCEVRIDKGEAVPSDVAAYSGVVLMGGPMSVNDDLPWIAELLSLVRLAIAQDVPVLGHCLGGQLMSKALGGQVTLNPYKEIGWGEVVVSDHPEATKWFGNTQSFMGFHWHGETFSLPVGAVHLLKSKHCGNQAFSLGRHMAFQCHIEMTADMIETWCNIGVDELLEAQHSPGVQTKSMIMLELAPRVAALNEVADRVYSHWVLGLKK